MSYFANAGQILVNFAFGALIALVVLRVLLEGVRANFYNPVCQFLYKLTNPVLMPLRKVIPAWRSIDLAAVLLAWLLSAAKLAMLRSQYPSSCAASASRASRFARSTRLGSSSSRFVTTATRSA